jgi:hypothetical protein
MGRQLKYSKVTLKAIYIFRQIFNLVLRQAEGLRWSNLNLAFIFIKYMVIYKIYMINLN